MSIDYYKIELSERRRMLADAGFARDDLRIWSHTDGRAIGEGVAAALTDEAFFRFLKIDPIEDPADEAVNEEELASAEADDIVH